MGELEKIDGECSKYSVDFVFVQDNDEATDYGVREDIVNLVDPMCIEN